MDFYRLKEQHKRHADSDVNTILLAITVISVLVIGAGLAGQGPLGPYIKLNTAGTGGGGQTGPTGAGSGGCASGYTPPTGFLCANLQAQYFVFDPLVAAGTGNGIASAQVSVINPVSLSSVDVPATTASTGLVSGGFYFISGNSYYCKVATSAYVTEFLPCFIPPISNTAQQVTTINIPLPQIKTDTWSWSATGGGTTWSSSFSAYNFALQGTTSVTMTFTLTANNNNQGFYSSYDLVKKVQNLAVFEFSSASSPLTTIAGCQFSYKLNNVQYCQFIMNDGFTNINGQYTQGSSAILSSFPTSVDGRYTATSPKAQTLTINGVTVQGSLSQQLAGTTLYGGSETFPVTFQLGSLSASGVESWTGKLFLYADVQYYDGGGGYTAQGTYGGDQSQATLTGGNSPTFTLKN